MQPLLPKLLCPTSESLEDFKQRLIKVRTEGTNADFFRILHDLVPDPAETPALLKFKESVAGAKDMAAMFWIADKLLYEDEVQEMITQLREMPDSPQRETAFAHARVLLQMRKLQELTLFLQHFVRTQSASTEEQAASSTTSPAASSTTSAAGSWTTSPAATPPGPSPAASPARRRVFMISDA